MRIISQLLLLATVWASTACGGVKSTVTIPPHQEFLLGENEPGSFSASLINSGDQQVQVVTRNAEGMETSSFGFPPEGKTKITVAAGEFAILINTSDRPARVETVLKEDVEGMRYQAAKMPEATATVDIEKLQPMVELDWAGTLTYIDYTSGEKNEIEVNLGVLQLSERSFQVNFKFPNEPNANNSSTLQVSSGGTQFDGRRVLSAAMKNGAYVIKTIEQGEEDGQSALLYHSYRISDQSLEIVKEYQTMGSDELKFRNAFRFGR